MKNIELNPGGIIGALLCAGITAAVIFSNVDVNDAGRGAYKMPIVALCGGAFAGNFLWGKMFKKDKYQATTPIRGFGEVSRTLCWSASRRIPQTILGFVANFDRRSIPPRQWLFHDVVAVTC